jgi:hypothetical protein
MMVLQHILVVVAQSFRVFHRNQELVVNTSRQQNIRTLKKTYGCATSQSIHARKPAMILRSEK